MAVLLKTGNNTECEGSLLVPYHSPVNMLEQDQGIMLECHLNLSCDKRQLNEKQSLPWGAYSVNTQCGLSGKNHLRVLFKDH